MSDYVAVGFLHTRQKVAGTPEEAGSLALAAGMDVETPAVYGYGPVLAKAVRDGKVPESLGPHTAGRGLEGTGVDIIEFSPANGGRRHVLAAFGRKAVGGKISRTVDVAGSGTSTRARRHSLTLPADAG